MAEQSYPAFPLESVGLIDCTSAPVLPQSEYRYPRSWIKGDKNSKTHGFTRSSWIYEVAASAEVDSSFQQRRKFAFSSDSHSWHELLNIHSSSKTEPNRRISVLSASAQSIRSSNSVQSSRNIFSVLIDKEKEELTNSWTSLSETAKPLLVTPDDVSVKLEDNSKGKCKTDLHVSANYEFDEKLLGKISDNNQENLKQDSLNSPVKIFSLPGILASYLVVGPLVVAYWNSTWLIFDNLLLSNGCQVSTWSSAAIGFTLMTVVTLFQDTLLRYSGTCSWLFRHVIMRLYTYLVSVACINQWRTIWNVLGCYVGTSLLKSAAGLVVASVLLILLGCLPTVLAPPVYIAVDVKHATYYKVPTFWNSPPTFQTSRKAVYFILDALITVFVIQVLTVTCWRTLWEILDFCLFPDDRQASAVWSIAISVGLGFMLLSLSIPTKLMSRCLFRLNWLLMLAWKNVQTVLYSVVCITYWRGIWMLLDLYSPHRPDSLYVAHGVSFVVLAICLASSSLLVRGAMRDDAQSADHGVRFDSSYLTSLLQAWRNFTDSKCTVNDKHRTETAEPCLTARQHKQDNANSLNIQF